MSIKEKLFLSGAIAVAIVSMLPAAAPAAPYVPPSNSAATQYTEALPTAGGPKATGGHKSGKKEQPVTVLGHQTANRLEEKGSEGKAAADFAAETAPAPVQSPPPSEASQSPPPPPSEASRPDHAPGGSASGGSTNTNTNSTGSGSSSPGSGSSALREVAGQATGLSSGDLGLLLPLLVLASICWGIGYLVHHRRRRHDLTAS